MGKSILLSKTIWVNILSLVATGTGFATGTLTQYPTLVCVLVLVQAVANLVLRLMTKESVTLTTTKLQSDVAKA
jgi:hypothetical protein